MIYLFKYCICPILRILYLIYYNIILCICVLFIFLWYLNFSKTRLFLYEKDKELWFFIIQKRKYKTQLDFLLNRWQQK